MTDTSMNEDKSFTEALQSISGNASSFGKVKVGVAKEEGIFVPYIDICGKKLQMPLSEAQDAEKLVVDLMRFPTSTTCESWRVELVHKGKGWQTNIYMTNAGSRMTSMQDMDRNFRDAPLVLNNLNVWEQPLPHEWRVRGAIIEQKAPAFNPATQVTAVESQGAAVSGPKEQYIAIKRP